MANRWGKEHKFSLWVHSGQTSSRVPWDENILLNPVSVILFFNVIFQCVVKFYTGRAHLIPLSPFFCSTTFPNTSLSASGQHLAGQLQMFYLWVGKSDDFHGHCLLLMQLCISNTINLMQKESNTSHSSFKIINTWLKQIGLDRYEPRTEFHANIPKKLGLLLYVVTWELIQFKEGILSDAKNSNFIVTSTSFLKSPGNYLSVRHPLAIQFF